MAAFPKLSPLAGMVRAALNYAHSPNTVRMQDAQNGIPARPQAEQEPEAYPPGYVEDSCELRTTPGTRRVSARRGRAGEKSDIFSILLEHF
jgi:hypothetical protein